MKLMGEIEGTGFLLQTTAARDAFSQPRRRVAPRVGGGNPPGNDSSRRKEYAGFGADQQAGFDRFSGQAGSG